VIRRGIRLVEPFREGLRPGERIPVRKLLYGLLLFSGNDDALALGQEVGGTNEGFVRLMNAEEGAHPSVNVHEPVNLGNPGEFTMRELAEEVARIVGRPLKTRFCPLPADDPRQRRPDITRANELLDWSPTVPLREGLRRTVEYFSKKVMRTEG
jgi:nucleoside-diphosphate-sugar epimerase